MNEAELYAAAVHAVLGVRHRQAEIAGLNARRDAAYAALVKLPGVSAHQVAREMHRRLIAYGVPESELMGRTTPGVSHDAVGRAAKTLHL